MVRLLNTSEAKIFHESGYDSNILSPHYYPYLNEDGFLS